jgi:hypothetical protein
MLHELIHTWFHWVEQGGYGAVIVLMAMESSIFPVPSEVVMPPAAILAAQGKMSLWGVIAAGVLMLVPTFPARIVGLNGLLVYMVVYFFQGIAIVAFYFRKKQVPRVARLLFYGIIGVQQVVMLAVIGVGFFDTWFNFRKLGTPLASH